MGLNNYGKIALGVLTVQGIPNARLGEGDETDDDDVEQGASVDASELGGVGNYFALPRGVKLLLCLGCNIFDRLLGVAARISRVLRWHSRHRDSSVLESLREQHKTVADRRS